MELTEVKDECVAIFCKLPDEYKVELGIPPAEFRRFFFGLASSRKYWCYIF